MEKHLNEAEIKSLIVKMYDSEEYLELNNYYSNESFFRTLKISRSELVHSNFLAWLFNPRSNHGLGTFPLIKFLQALSEAKEKEYNLNADLPVHLAEKFLLEDYTLSLYSTVRTEVPIDNSFSDKNGRIDILLDLKFSHEDKTIPIIIENKVLSTENKKGKDIQTIKYYTWAKSHYFDKAKYYDPIFVFLAPDYESDIKCECESFVKISYQNLVDHLIEPCLSLSNNAQTIFFIENYLRCLSNSTLEEISSGKEKRIMAFPKKEKELLQKFHDKNKILFDAVLTMMSDDEEITDEERKLLDKTRSVSNAKDYSKYLFEGELYSKRRCVLAIVNYVAKENGICDFETLLEIFPDSLQKPGSSGVIRKLNQVKDKKRYFSKKENIINLNGDEVVVTNQWGADNFPIFLNYVEEKFGISVQKQ